MNEASLMCEEETSLVTPNATSSQESADGHTHYNLQDGQQLDLFGQLPAHVSPGHALVKSEAPKTSATSGPRLTASSTSAALQQSLASRFQTWNGQTPRRMTWKQLVTLSGRKLDEQIPLDCFTNDDGSTGLLPTPVSSDNRNRGTINKSPSIARRIALGKQVGLSTLFDGRPCPFCVAAIIGYPPGWVSCAVEALEIPSPHKSRRSS